MRAISMLPATVALAFALTGCGTVAAPATSTQASAIAARGTVTAGQLVFDKEVVYSTIDVLGIGAVYHDKLAAVGIKTVKELLMAGGKRSDRARLAKQTGISEKLILTWVNHGDLMRVTGAGPEYSRLLELAGVDTTVELAKRLPANLADSLKAANNLGGGKVATHRVPDVTTTTKWVANAREFARLVSY